MLWTARLGDSTAVKSSLPLIKNEEGTVLGSLTL